jgi:large subunit ribosomal protein L22
MLNVNKLKELCRGRKMSIEALAEHLVKGGFDKDKAIAAVRNWQKGLFKPVPSKEDIRRAAEALGVEENDLTDWCSACRWAPFSASKARLVAQLIVGRGVQDAMDTLKFTRKRAAQTIDKVLRSAVANADEQQADVENLYVTRAWVEDAGVRAGTKRWRAKDRGRAHAIRSKACHIHVAVTEA